MEGGEVVEEGVPVVWIVSEGVQLDFLYKETLLLKNSCFTNSR